jgi:hypothetical protein
MVARFQAGSVPVFLLSLKAGGVGLNLTQATHVIHYDRWWNPASQQHPVERQNPTAALLQCCKTAVRPLTCR